MNQLQKPNQFIHLNSKAACYTFLPSGDVFTFQKNQLLINQFRGNQIGGSVNNIYLRIYEDHGITFHPLLGIASGSTVSCNDKILKYTGTVSGLSYCITFCPINDSWFWNIVLDGYCEKAIDLIYGQDLGVSDAGGIYANELYISQYLGHTVLKGTNGFVVCSRQNQPCSSGYPYVQQGAIGIPVIHYSTDGLQFFGLPYKETNQPDALYHDLPDRNLQYECAYTALQTERFYLNGTKEFCFYGIFKEDHPFKITELEYQDELLSDYEQAKKSISSKLDLKDIHIQRDALFGTPVCSEDFTEEEIKDLFPERILEEREDDELFSFFLPDNSHVVTSQKELHCDRPHGTIIITPPDTEKVSSNLISSTQYMNGIFASHVVIGNTNVHKFISTPRSFLDFLKTGGLRIWIKLDGTYRLLSVPGLYEMGMNYSKWYYKLNQDRIVITSYTASSGPDLILEMHSERNLPYDFVLTAQLSGGVNEYEHNIPYSAITGGLQFNMGNEAYPGLSYDILFPDHSFTLSDDRIFYNEKVPEDETFLTFSFQNQSELKMLIRGHLFPSAETVLPSYDFEQEKQNCLRYYDAMIRHFRLQSEEPSEQIHILNTTAHWYAHNALVHFAMPHGLEQPGGAAWGTRDICQGPFEFFLATEHYSLLRDILLNIFSHQNYVTKEWPQWFMFDRYHMDAGECHGDVVFWPLKCVADYISACGDTSILSEELKYEGSDKKATLLEHIRLALSGIKGNRFVSDLGLITYAGGDWDDTLQPVEEEMKKRLVSAWTQALAYQTFHSLSEAVRTTDSSLTDELTGLAETAKDAFDRFLIKDQVVAGFVEYDHGFQYLLHPDDKRTGIHYRLLPMTRSIISELADGEQAIRNTNLIHQYLKCPDGVRLMDKPAHYDGGVSTLFKRAEQSANVGREISLQYTHAHIRYIEAMAKLGYGSEAWNSLFIVNPVLIRKTVPNALLRQSNMYFSSSEGAFDDRYEYARNFHLLKTGDIPVKGGWRLYSSGPGIYLHQLISNILGIRFSEKGLILDPVIAEQLTDCTLDYDCYGRTLHFHYRLSEDGTIRAVSEGHVLAAAILDNPYRRGGILLAPETIQQASEDIDLFC